MNKFSSDFLIGAATAAHQVEGNNIHSDYWAMEHMAHSTFNEPSLDAVDHYNRYEEDIQLMAQAGLSAYRFQSSGRALSRRKESLMRQRLHITGVCLRAVMQTISLRL